MAETIGIGMLGYGFVGRAHSSALRQIRYMTWPPPLIPELVSIAGRTEDALVAAAAEFGFAEHVTDWRALVSDPRVGLFDNTGPNSIHVEPSITAAEAGKHVVCEKRDRALPRRLPAELARRPIDRQPMEARQIGRRVGRPRRPRLTCDRPRALSCRRHHRRVLRDANVHACPRRCPRGC